MNIITNYCVITYRKIGMCNVFSVEKILCISLYQNVSNEKKLIVRDGRNKT